MRRHMKLQKSQYMLNEAAEKSSQQIWIGLYVYIIVWVFLQGYLSNAAQFRLSTSIIPTLNS